MSPRPRVGRLDVHDHDRAAAGMRYVYPVVSRRAGGVSLGINLNPNNACNWRCVYCQVPGLGRGKGPAIDLALLEQELDELLEEVLHGEFMTRSVPKEARRLNDVAFSGNGEPTTSPDFGSALDVVGKLLGKHSLLGRVKLVLITNGSMLGKPEVKAAVGRLAAMSGQVWFKLDSATPEGNARINDHRGRLEDHLARLESTARLCPTWVQTCWFLWGGKAPDRREAEAYLAALAALRARGVPLAGVQLYTLARPSTQPEAPELAPMPRAELEAFGREIEALGYCTVVSV